MAVHNGDICKIKDTGLTLRGDPDVATEATHFESILKDAFGVPKDGNLLTAIFHPKSALNHLGSEQSHLDNDVNPIFRRAVLEKVAQDLAHDQSMPALILEGPTAPYLSIQNRVQDKEARAALPNVAVIMATTACKR